MLKMENVLDNMKTKFQKYQDIKKELIILLQTNPLFLLSLRKRTYSMK